MQDNQQPKRFRPPFSSFAFSLIVGCGPIQVGRTLDSDAGVLVGGAMNQGDGDATALCTGSLQIRGRVVSTRGEPLAGVQLSLSETNVTTLTDAKGQYAFDQLCPGKYTLTPHRADLRFCTEQAEFLSLTQNEDAEFTGSTDGCQASEMVERVEVVVFDPDVDSGRGVFTLLSEAKHWQDPWDLAQRYARTVETVTNGKIRFDLKRLDVHSFPYQSDGFAYTESAYMRCLTDVATCHPPEQPDTAEQADYQRLASDQGLCELVNQGKIDEVWLLGGPHFGFSALERLGPAAATSSPWSVIGSNCSRVIDVLGFGYEHGVDAALRDVHAQAEAVLDQVYPDWTDDNRNSTWSRYSRARQLSATYDTSGCGGHRYAPNATLPDEYDNPASVDSYCNDFYVDPLSNDVTASLESTNCEAWGCSRFGFDRYWFRHLPSVKGIDNDGKLANWWRYLLHPDDLMSQTEVTCSSSLQSGWCDQVIDGEHGHCNEQEWATASLPTGWVEFRWPEGKDVTSVLLYDRACPDRVVSAHLEFSDGSLAIPFGPLEDTGTTGKEITFESKHLKWLRVVIDSSDGPGNPGFGEISIE